MLVFSKPQRSFFKDVRFISTSYFLIALLLLGACKKRRITRNIDPNIPTAINADTTNEQVKVAQCDFEYFSSKAKIYFSDGKEEEKAKINIRIKKDSLIWLNMHKSGIEGLRVMITQDSVFIINRVQKTYSAYNFKELNKRYNFNFNYQLLQSVIIGEMPIKKYYNRNVFKNDEFYIIRQTDGIVSIDNFVNKEQLRLNKLRVLELATNNTLDLSYGDFEDINNSLFPKTNQAALIYKSKQGLLNIDMEIQHENIELNEIEMKFPFNVPKSYEIKN